MANSFYQNINYIISFFVENIFLFLSRKQEIFHSNPLFRIRIYGIMVWIEKMNGEDTNGFNSGEGWIA